MQESRIRTKDGCARLPLQRRQIGTVPLNRVICLLPLAVALQTRAKRFKDSKRRLSNSSQ